MTEQDWKLLQNVHLDGAYQVTKAAWPYMREKNYGRIIMVTSAAGLYGESTSGENSRDFELHCVRRFRQF